ncbi:MAG: 2-C-methyl-D-erythritol 4-phosphate cytidylyltransferase [Firmicutes bacterium]|nr:2-C-methyl-D-erythritol 4-phosphate cytidylyltransferase [Bacillota bacterium]
MQIVEGVGAAKGRAAAVIVAAGRSERFGCPKKQFVEVAGAPVLVHTVRALAVSPLVEYTVIVVPSEDLEQVRDRMVPQYALTRVAAVVAGGADRQESVYRGLQALTGDVEWVLIHDGVRPLVTPDLVDRLISAASRTGAATLGVPVRDTIKQASPDGTVRRTIDRSGLWRIQTPQAFRLDVILNTHASAAAGPVRFTDDAGLVESAGGAVTVVEGNEANVKVTTRGDLFVVESLLLRKVGPAGGREVAGESRAPATDHGGPAPDRIGIGYDVHRARPGDGVTLGGVFIPCGMSLEGHSDADVLCHAVMDAILGACGERDIGTHFPPGDPAYRNASSVRLLGRVREMALSKGLRVGNVDTVLVAEKPKVSGYVAEMKRVLGGVLGVSEDRVGIKATTSEGVGFAGRGEGVCAWATVRLEPIGGAGSCR